MQIYVTIAVLFLSQSLVLRCQLMFISNRSYEYTGVVIVQPDTGWKHSKQAISLIVPLITLPVSTDVVWPYCCLFFTKTVLYSFFKSSQAGTIILNQPHYS